MIVRLHEDSMGNLIVTPSNESLRRSFVRDARANGAPEDFDGSVFMQQPSIDDVRDAFGPRAVLTTRRWRDSCTPDGQINDGARIRVDEWAFRRMLGYSAV